MVHEFEALLFVDGSALDWMLGASLAQLLTTTAAAYASPEHINDGAATHPAARILAAFPGYEKPLHGPMAVEAIGLHKARATCPHFAEWLSHLETA